MNKKEKLFKCHHCGKTFSREHYFINHKCRNMKRLEDMRTMLGQRAWMFYKDWLRLQKKRVPDDRTFISSTFYNSFMKFARFVKKTQLPFPDEFMKFAISKNYPPTFWTYNDIFLEYQEHLNTVVPMEKHIEKTFETIFDLADIFDCKSGDIFNYLEANDLLILLRQRKLSPLVLLVSAKFYDYIEKVKSDHPELYTIISTNIRYNYWQKRLQDNPTSLKTVRDLVNRTKL